MRNRVVPVMFWVAIVSCASLVVSGGVLASRPTDRVPYLVGYWDGYFEDAEPDGKPGLLTSIVKAQAHRQIAGVAQMRSIDDGALLNAFNYTARFPRADSLTGRGVSRTGRVVFNSSLELFGGSSGYAGVMQPRFQFVPARGRPSPVGAVLLHPFPGAGGPNVAGESAGTFRSELDPGFLGDMSVEFRPKERGAFPGRIELLPHSLEQPPISWQCRATTSEEGRFIMIAQGRTGRLVADGVVIPNPGGEPSTFIGGFYRLLLRDGRFDYGAYNFTLSPAVR